MAIKCHDPYDIHEKSFLIPLGSVILIRPSRAILHLLVSMKLSKILVGGILILSLFSIESCGEATTDTPTEGPLNMVQAFPGLFEAVQMAHIFPDSKTIADCTPKRDPQLIVVA